MTLGSPVGSPGHHSPMVHQTSHGNQFLPGYLMGDVSASAVSFTFYVAKIMF